MRSWRSATLVLALATLVASCGGGGERGAEEGPVGEPPLPPDVGNPTPRVGLETNRGQIVMQLDREKAPRTVENILLHVENGFYDGLIFHRVLPGRIIQAGAYTPEMRRRQSPRPTVPNEANNGLRNVRGSVAMARLPDPHSATTQFFVNLVDNPRLDFTAETAQGWGYAVFGHVVEGMDVVDAIGQTPTGSQGTMSDVPLQPVIIRRAYVEGG